MPAKPRKLAVASALLKFDESPLNDDKSAAVVTEGSSEAAAEGEEPSAKRPRMDGDVHLIQDCHADLGDKHCSGRTTVATVILREFKLKYREKYKGKGGGQLVRGSHDEYYERLRAQVPRMYGRRL